MSQGNVYFYDQLQAVIVFYQIVIIKQTDRNKKCYDQIEVTFVLNFGLNKLIWCFKEKESKKPFFLSKYVSYL